MLHLLLADFTVTKPGYGLVFWLVVLLVLLLAVSIGVIVWLALRLLKSLQ